MTDEWIMQLQFIYTIENFASVGLNYAVCCNWIALENIMLRDASQKEKDKYWVLSFICRLQTDQEMEGIKALTLDYRIENTKEGRVDGTKKQGDWQKHSSIVQRS